MKYSSTRPLRAISLGAGVQSSTMLMMYELGVLKPRPHLAIFADTKLEPARVYEWLEWLRAHTTIPIVTVSRGNLWRSATRVRTTRDGQRRYIETAVPVFMLDGLKRGKGMRHCTRDFKISPVRKELRRQLGLRQIPRRMGRLVKLDLGISMDEIERMKPSNKPWIEHCYPLIDLRPMTREECRAWMRRRGFPDPPRSACVECPFRSDAEWLSLSPKEFTRAVANERALQKAYSATVFEGVPYLHKSRVPLSKVEFKEDPEKPSAFGNECEGMCGV